MWFRIFVGKKRIMDHASGAFIVLAIISLAISASSSEKVRLYRGQNGKGPRL
jgi:hypothetical protein